MVHYGIHRVHRTYLSSNPILYMLSHNHCKSEHVFTKNRGARIASTKLTYVVYIIHDCSFNFNITFPGYKIHDGPVWTTKGQNENP